MVQFNQKSAEEELRKSIVDMFKKLDEVPISRITITEKYDIFSSFYTGLDTGYDIGWKYSGVTADESSSNTLYSIRRIMDGLQDTIEERWLDIKEYIRNIWSWSTLIK